MNPIKVLSTKKLPKSIKLSYLFDFEVDELNVIQPYWLPTKEKIKYKNWIFTSVNGVKFALKSFDLLSEKPTSIFCVGSKTEQALIDSGLKVTLCTESSNELCKMLNSNTKYTFFCGTNRLETIPEFLGDKAQILQLYEIKKSFPKLESTYDAYLFFSPSGVDSFVKFNPIPKNSTTFAIGKTTADSLENYTDKIVTPPNFNLKKLLLKVREYYDKE